MASNEKYIVSLRKHIFSAPSPIVSLVIYIVLTILAYIVHPNIINILLLFITPFIVTIILDYIAIKSIRIYFPINRITTLNILGYGISFVIFIALSFFFSFNFAYYLGFATIIDIRYVIYRAFLAERKNYASIISSFYTITIFIISVAYTPSFPWIPFTMASSVFLIVGYLFIITTTAPFRREFREDPLFFISAFVNYITRFKKEDETRLNHFFYNIYENRTVPISIMVFKAKSKIKAIFVAPYIHPGPFGKVGGSDIPNKLEKMLNMENLMVFHTTTTHDNNIASNEDVSKIANVIKNMSKGECKYDKMSDFVIADVKGVSVGMQAFGKYAFVALIPKNANFDDVELDTGLYLRKLVLESGFEDMIALDAHDCFNENALPLSLLKSDIEKIREYVARIKSDKKLRMGFSKVEFKGESIGPGGIRAAVFEYGAKKIAYILLDGNNIKKGLRDRIITSVDADKVEVFSTDNHIVNVTMMDLNPVGERDSWDELIDACKRAVKEASEDIENVCVYAKTEQVELRMATGGNLKKMTDITKESVKTAAIMTPILFTVGFLISFFIFYFML